LFTIVLFSAHRSLIAWPAAHAAYAQFQQTINKIKINIYAYYLHIALRSQCCPVSRLPTATDKHIFTFPQALTNKIRPQQKMGRCNNNNIAKNLLQNAFKN